MTRIRVLAVAAALVALVAGVGGETGAAEPNTSTYIVTNVVGRQARTDVARTGAGIDEVGRDYLLVQATGAEKRAIESLGYTVEPSIAAAAFPAADADYHDFAEMRADLAALVAAYPDRVHPFIIGWSSEGRPLEGVRISDDAEDNPAEPGVLLVASHHGREHLTVEVALDLAHLFAESNDPAVLGVVATRQIYVVPNLNPDGSEYDIATGDYRRWRKNRQPNGGTAPIGTDLNRNYSYKWGCCGGSSGNKGSETYRGLSPFSAPETAALRKFVDARPNITTSISYHAYGNLILYPYGYTYTDVPSDMTRVDHDTFVAMARQMASTTGYRPQQASDLYITDGDLDDWLYGAKGVYAFTFELGGGGFYPDDSRIPIEQAKNREAAVYAAQMADCPTRAVGVTCGVGPPPPPPNGAVVNGGFESGLAGWAAQRATAVTSPVHDGAGAARLGGVNSTTSRLTQTVTVPANGVLQLYVRVAGDETSGSDVLRVRVASGGTTRQVATLTSSTVHDTWTLLSADLGSYAGKSVELRLIAAVDGATPTTFFVDDVTL